MSETDNFLFRSADGTEPYTSFGAQKVSFFNSFTSSVSAVSRQDSAWDFCTQIQQVSERTLIVSGPRASYSFGEHLRIKKKAVKQTKVTGVACLGPVSCDVNVSL